MSTPGGDWLADALRVAEEAMGWHFDDFRRDAANGYRFTPQDVRAPGPGTTGLVKVRAPHTRLWLTTARVLAEPGERGRPRYLLQTPDGNRYLVHRNRRAADLLVDLLHGCPIPADDASAATEYQPTEPADLIAWAEALDATASAEMALRRERRSPSEERPGRGGRPGR